jgi:hypothetical protein
MIFPRFGGRWVKSQDPIRRSLERGKFNVTITSLDIDFKPYWAENKKWVGTRIFFAPTHDA